MSVDPKIDAWRAQALAATSVDAVKQILHDEKPVCRSAALRICVANRTVRSGPPWVKGVTGPPGAGWVWPGPFPNGDWIDNSGN